MRTVMPRPGVVLLSVTLLWVAANEATAFGRPSSSSFLHASTKPSILRSATTTAETESSSPIKGEAIRSVVLVENEEFVKSDPDKREYRAIRLEPSQLEVLLVSDGDTDVEAAAVHVKAGHFCDPPNRAGLAHFHEHMLFLGTTKYPDEHDYENFLSKNGGSTNAYTDMQDTNYYFSVAPLDHDEDDDEDDNDGAEESTDEGGTSAALSGALDRFAQFFISPSFAVESVERELRAINSEHLNSITSDQWRNYQLLKNGCNPSHPFHKFGCGNYKTLTDGGDIAGESAETSGGSSPRDDLLQFWNDNYQSKSLKLCVVGRASLDDLQKTVEDTFGYVPPPTSAPVVENLSSAASPLNGDKLEFPLENSRGMAAFGEEQLGRVREVVPIMDSRSIKLYFAFPPMNDPLLKETHPYRVISHLLGHESPGSLHYLLNDEGLINGLSSGTGVGVTDFSLATFSMSLTPEGMKKRDYVLSLVFQWISLVQSVIENDEHGLMEQYHDELRRIATMNFRFRENGDPTDFASGAAELMFEYEPSLILAGSAFTKEYRPELAKALMERMNPENVLITISDQDLDKENSPHADSETSLGASEWQTEQWYRAKYREEKISQAVMEKWKTQEIDPRLKLPDLNAFIPDDFSLKCEDPEEKTDPSMDYSKQPPCLLIDRPDSLRMWHKLDRTWKVPKTSIRMHLTSPNLYRSPRTMTMARLYQKVLNDDLNSFVYDASVAGCNYRVNCAPTGFRVSVSGYSEKLPNLLDTVTARMLSLLREMKEGPEAHPGLAQKFNKAIKNLCRETKNYKLDSPYEVGSYNSRILMENPVWHVDSYIAELEGEYAEKDPVTMQECADTVEHCLRGRVKAEALCIGNINEKEALKVASVIEEHFLAPSRPLTEDENPKFRSFKLPTRAEAVSIFGVESTTSRSIPLIVEDMVPSESEENNSVEVILQAGSDFELGYQGTAIMELIGHIAYTSAFGQLRTKEQLGYIVSAFNRKTAGGAASLCVVVQSSVALPEHLEQRCEAWLASFQQELADMPEERLAMEAGAVVAQLLERDAKLSDEIGSVWGEILGSETLSARLKQPVFDRLERFAEYLTLRDDVEDDVEVESQSTSVSPTAAELKQQVLAFFEKHFSADSEDRRAMSSRVYGHKGKEVFESHKGTPGILSNYSDVRHVKQYLSLYPLAPY